MCGVKTASHNRDFDLETTLGPSVSDLFWGKNEETVLEALRARCPSCFLTSLSLFYKWSCRCRSAATQRRAAGERSSTVAGLCRLGPVRCVGTAVASPRRLALLSSPDEKLTESRPTGCGCVLTNGLTNGAHEEGAGGWERGQLFPWEYVRQKAP